MTTQIIQTQCCLISYVLVEIILISGGVFTGVMIVKKARENKHWYELVNLQLLTYLE